jgi:hypothetical protein
VLVLLSVLACVIPPGSVPVDQIDYASPQRQTDIHTCETYEGHLPRPRKIALKRYMI